MNTCKTNPMGRRNTYRVIALEEIIKILLKNLNEQINFRFHAGVRNLQSLLEAFQDALAVLVL